MKKITKLLTSLLVLLLMTGSIFAYGGNGNSMMKGKDYGNNQGGQVYEIYDDTQVDHQEEINLYPVEDLSEDEEDGLILMREEEKLARDVYLELYDVWGMQIFSNIASSEQTHTDAIKLLLDKYDLEDPVTNDERGVFTNEDLQELYTELVELGSTSLINALTVGATIEDLDIKDLQDLNEISDNQDITAVYNNLEKGSRNHLRSFTKTLERNGASYEARYITEEEYLSIISSDLERGTEYDSQGNASASIRNGNMGTSYNNENSNAQANRSNMAAQNGMGQGNQNNPNSVYEANQEQNQEQTQNAFVRMWRGFKNWFS